MSFEQLFSTSDLSVVAPDTSLEFPPNQPAEEWLTHLTSTSIDRKQAFFDEQLQFIAVLKIEHPEPNSPADEAHPSEALLSFLAHIQITLEATYISPIPIQQPEPPTTARLLSAPPRTGSLALAPTARAQQQQQQHHPSIFPPSTPNPTPAATDHDRKYVQSEGTPLLAGIWGQNNAPDSMERFALLWSEKDKVWVAVYRMALTVSFLRLNFHDPLLCLTVSATLRDKPVVTPSTQNPLADYLVKAGSQLVAQPDTPATPGDEKKGEYEEVLEHLEEVNLLEGLFSGPTFANMGEKEINFPSTRLGTVSRQKLFGLPPVSIPTPTAPSPSPLTAVRKAHPTLRKSFRKTLQTVSGFRVRMRTVFVPYVLLPTPMGEAERDRREAGTEERTVVLCVEVENSGEAGRKVGFMVEKVDVNIGGEGAKTTLIGWGDAGLGAAPENSIFPLKITPLAQVNLLYAVTFVRSPEELDAFSYAKRRSLTAPGGPGLASELQKAVAINVFGKPFMTSTDEDGEADTEGEGSKDEEDTGSEEDSAYPTETFSSRWNCVLDLTVHSLHPPADDMEAEPSALPEPPSPFPTYALKSAISKGFSPGTSMFSAATLSSPPLSSSIGSIPDGRRHTLPTPIAGLPARSLKSITPNRASLPFMLPMEGGGSPRGPSPSPSNASPSGRMSTYPPPSALREYLRSPTTYAAPPPPPPPQSPPAQYDPPMTPAYPAFPPRSELPPTPMSQGPLSQVQGTVGPSVEIRREKGSGMISGPPPTPGPSVPASYFASQQGTRTPKEPRDLAESIVISIGMLDEDLDEDEKFKGKIYPQDVFTLDIFVFNQSTWVRRFEITCPSGRKRGKGGQVYGPLGGGGAKPGHGKAGPEYPGVMPLDGRVRIGPLRPSSCQSVRMDFVAISPGVHSIEALTLTDIETGYSMNLRSVMDVVVHDPND